jgi:hypothetical protein
MPEHPYLRGVNLPGHGGRRRGAQEGRVSRLTFELSGPRRQGALAARRMIGLHRLAAKVPCRRGSARAKG